MFFIKNITQKTILCLLIFINCAIVINAQNNDENAASKLSSHILKYISNNIGSTTGDPSRAEIVNLFIQVFNNRHHINRSFGDPDDYLQRTQLRGETFVLLNNTLHGSSFLSDGQDARNYTFKIMVSLMTLAILTPDLERAIEAQQRRPRSVNILSTNEMIITRLQELNKYLSGIIENGQHDVGHLIKEDIIFINDIIQQMTR